MGYQQSPQLPPDLQRWAWVMNQMKSGPRRNPGGWWQFIFVRLHGLAEGDDQLNYDDASLRVKVRRPSLDEALAAAVEQMRERSASLEPGKDYDRLMKEHMDRLEELWRIALEHTPKDWLGARSRNGSN
jgi:hypothetical protein